MAQAYVKGHLGQAIVHLRCILQACAYIVFKIHMSNKSTKSAIIYCYKNLDGKNLAISDYLPNFPIA